MEGVRAAPAPARPATEDVAEDRVYDKGRFGRLLNSSIGTVAIAALLIALAGGALFWQREAVKSGLVGILTLARGPSAQAPRDTAATAPSRAKISDRIGQPDKGPLSTQEARGRTARRAVRGGSERHQRQALTTAPCLEPGERGGRPRSADGQGYSRGHRHPERNMTVTFTIRRNTDKDLPASHTVSIDFTLPPDFVHGGDSGNPRSADEADRTGPWRSARRPFGQGDERVLPDRLSPPTRATFSATFSCSRSAAGSTSRIVYTDNRRAIMAVEKGPPGRPRV